jgi:hypothetical protein
MMNLPKIEGNIESLEEEVDYKEEMIKVEVDIKLEKEELKQPSILRRRGKGKKPALTASERQKKYVKKKKAEEIDAYLQKEKVVMPKVVRQNPLSRREGMVDCRNKNTESREEFYTQTDTNIREEFVNAMNNYRNRVVAVLKEHPTDPGMIRATNAMTKTFKKLKNCSSQTFQLQMNNFGKNKAFMQMEKRMSELENPNKFEQIVKKFRNNLSKV